LVATTGADCVFTDAAEAALIEPPIIASNDRCHDQTSRTRAAPDRTGTCIRGFASVKASASPGLRTARIKSGRGPARVREV